MAGPFKMKGSSLYGHGNSSPAKKKVKNEDGSTTRTRKNILTGKTKTIIKDGNTKKVTVKNKAGDIVKEKVVVKGGPKTVQKYDAKTGEVTKAKRVHPKSKYQPKRVVVKGDPVPKGFAGVGEKKKKK